MADSISTPSTTDVSWRQTWGNREFIERWVNKVRLAGADPRGANGDGFTDDSTSD